MNNDECIVKIINDSLGWFVDLDDVQLDEILYCLDEQYPLKNE